MIIRTALSLLYKRESCTVILSQIRAVLTGVNVNVG